RIIIADKVTSLTAAQAVSSALFARERQGKGQHIKLSMLDTMISFFWAEGMAGLVYGEKEFDVRKLQGTQDLIYKAKDRYITAGAVSDKEWAGMCRALKREDWLDDERFNTSAARVANANERKEMTAAEIENWDSAELLARFQEEGVPCAPLLDRMELMAHPQIIANGSIEKTMLEGFGEVRQARPAAQFSETPSCIDIPAPKLGEHGRDILGALGYDAAEQDKLIADGKLAIAD
ncbi:MAG: CoA transferase, partial [Parvibaculales bacterium]